MNSITFPEFIKKNLVIFDGAIGTEIYKQDIFVNQCFDDLNISKPEIIKNIHHAYLEAGANVLTTNTYGANRIELSQFGLADKTILINQAGVKIAQEIAAQSKDPIYIAGSIGPGVTNGLSTDTQHALIEQVTTLISNGVDFIIFETQPNRTAVENCANAILQVKADFPFIISVKPFGMISNSELTDFQKMLAPLNTNLPQPLAWGINCGNGPDVMLTLVQRIISYLDRPLVIQPNAGESKFVNGRQLFLTSPEYFTTYARRYMELGAKGIGGCCGIGPAHISDMARSLKPLCKNVVLPQPTISMIKEIELQAEKPLAERSKLGYKLANKQWIKTIEIVPPTSYDLTKIIEKASYCASAGIDCINIPDGPRASARISPFFTALKIQQEAKIETTIHVCSRDRNLIGIQADLLACAGAGINNILFITGDPPKLGKYPFASAVFDVDAIGLTHLQKRLNQGIDLSGQEIKPQTHAVIGVGADPNALDLDREILRLHQKVEAGAEFVTTQPIFETDVLLRFMEKMQDLNLPVIAGVWPLASYRNATFMKNEVPGVVVPDWIMEKMSKLEDKEDQRKMGIEIARISIERIRDAIAGIQVSAPFGNIQTSLAVID